MPLQRALSGIVAGDFNDPTNERIIYLSAAGLGILGLGLLFGTLMWWRRSRQEHPALAPLEVMSARAWEKAPEGDRRRRLEQVRLAGAAGSVGERQASDPVDLQALVRSAPNSFDDLKEPSADVDTPDAFAESAVAEPDVAVQPAKPDLDATSISTERPVAPPEPVAEPSKESTK